MCLHCTSLLYSTPIQCPSSQFSTFASLLITSLYHYYPMWWFVHLYPNYDFTKGYSSIQNLTSTSNLIITIRDSAVPSQYSITLHYALTIPLATALRPHLDLSQQSETQLHLHHRTPHLTTPFPSYSALDKTVLYLHHTSYYYTMPWLLVTAPYYVSLHLTYTELNLRSMLS